VALGLVHELTDIRDERRIGPMQVIAKRQDVAQVQPSRTGEEVVGESDLGTVRLQQLVEVRQTLFGHDPQLAMAEPWRRLGGSVALGDPGRVLPLPGWIRRSNHWGELIECCCQDQPGTSIDPKFVVTSAQVLDERVASHDDAGCPGSFQSAHRAEPGLQAAVIGLDSVVGVLGGVMERPR
jgi:hypothetical protein